MIGVIMLLTSFTTIADSTNICQDNKNTVGTEFILIFLNNKRTGTPLQISMATPITDKQIQVRVYTPAWNSSDSIDFNVTVQYGSKIVVNLPESLRMETASKDFKSVFVSADDAIVLFGSNIQLSTGDVFLVYPVSTLGLEYVALMYEQSLPDHPAVLGCVATFDLTHVNVSLPDDTTAEFDGLSNHIGVIQIELTRYELFQIKAKDLTGTIIQSNKAIACFSGTGFVRIATVDTSKDHIVEQLKPISTWSNYFVVVVNPDIKLSLSGEVIRIVCCNEDTKISVSIHNLYRSLVEVQNFSLSPGKFHESFLQQGGSAIISSDSPISVAQFSVSGGIDTDTGDPSMILTPAVDEYLSDYTFVYPGDNLANAYTTGLVLVSDCHTVDAIKHDSITITNTWTQIGDSSFYYTHLVLSNGFHRIKSATCKFGGYLFGYGINVAYGTSIGRSMSTHKQRKVTPIPGSINESKFVLKGRDTTLTNTPSYLVSTRSLQECLKTCALQTTCEYVAFHNGLDNTCIIYLASSNCPVFATSAGYKLYERRN